MGTVIRLARRAPKPRSRRITVTLSGPLLAQVEAAAKRAGVSMQTLLRVGVGDLLNRHDERVERAQRQP